MKLYELSKEYNEILAIIEGEIEEEGAMSETTLAMLDEIDEDFAEKSENCVKAVRIYEEQLESVESEYKRLRNLRKHIKKQVSGLKDYIATQMITTGQEVIQTDLFKLRLQDSPMKVEYSDIEEVDPDWVQEKVKKFISKKDIAEHIKNTGEVPKGITARKDKHLRIY